MITRLTGELENVDGGRAVVATGPMAVELLVPAADVGALSVEIGTTVTFHTMTLLEGQGQGSSFVPRLLGFRSPSDRAFFELFTTVKGIGPRKAMRALAMRPAEIAAAVASRDTRLLATLPEVGKRTAETIVAELGGKVDPFLEEADASTGAAATIEPSPLGAAAEDAIAILAQLGESAAEARRLVERAVSDDPGLDDPASIVEVAYRHREPARPS